MLRRLLICTVAVLLASTSTFADDKCVPIPIPPVDLTKSLFTPQQEQELGEIVAQATDRYAGVIVDEQVTGHMQQIVDRLLTVLPPTDMKVRLIAVRAPVVNAWSTVGGRIYVTRKLIAFVRSEDELAGILAHELGHIVMRQSALEMGEMFRQAGVTSVSDRADIEAKFQRFLDTVERNPSAFHLKHEENKEQLIADRVAMEAMTRAGYLPAALVEAIDRLQQTKGKTGNWFSDLFGTTPPTQKRLRELLKEAAAASPAPCISKSTPSAEFQKWQAAVVADTGLQHTEAVHSVVLKRQLNPPLRGSIHYLRFSNDGKYVLAQDEASIYVLTREPLAPVFRIDARGAYAAQFTPDSQAVVFHTPAQRVEQWRIDSKQMLEAHEITSSNACVGRTVLSPDAKLLSCVYLEGGGAGVKLIDVVTGNVRFEKHNMHYPGFEEALELMLAGFLGRELRPLLHTGFSPDGRYFVAAAREGAVALQLPDLTPVSLPGSLKQLLGGGFSFMNGDRVAAFNAFDYKKSEVRRFPSGEVVTRMALLPDFNSVTKGDYLLIRPVPKFALGVEDANSSKVVFSSTTPAVDVYDNVFAHERATGTVALYPMPPTKTSTVVAEAGLPLGPLGSIKAFAVSDDMKWLAVSVGSRAAVWNLQTGERVMYVRGFNAAYFSNDGKLFADMAAFNENPRGIAWMMPGTNNGDYQIKLDDDSLKSADAQQYGQYLLLRHFSDKGDKGSLEVRDLTSKATLWTREFQKAMPRIYGDDHSGKLLLAFAGETAKTEGKRDSSLQALIPEFKKNEDRVQLLEILDAATGKTAGSLSVVATGNPDIVVAGDRVLVTSRNRTVIYSTSSRQQVGAIFGNSVEAHAEQSLIAALNDSWHLSLYDLNTLAKKEEFAFASPIGAIRFTRAGDKLLVLTTDQMLYVLSTSGPSNVIQASTPN